MNKKELLSMKVKVFKEMMKQPKNSINVLKKMEKENPKIVDNNIVITKNGRKQ